MSGYYQLSTLHSWSFPFELLCNLVRVLLAEEWLRRSVIMSQYHGIDREIVPKSAYTGQCNHCRTFSCRVETFPQCRLYISTPFYTDLSVLSVLRKHVSQLIIGQLKGVKKCTNHEIRQWYRKHGIEPKVVLARCKELKHTYTANDQIKVANVVTTRSERRQYIKRLQHEQEQHQTIQEQL